MKMKKKPKASQLGKILLPAFRKITRDLKARKPGRKRWEYKDSHRCYWVFSATRGRQTPPDASGFFETEWEVAVRREDDLVYDTILSAQYNQDVSLHDILVDYSTYVIGMVTGAARFAFVPLPGKKKP